MPEANVSKVGHEPKMGQSDFDCPFVSVVFTIISVVFYSPYTRPVRQWEQLACFRPFFVFSFFLPFFCTMRILLWDMKLKLKHCLTLNIGNKQQKIS